MEIKQDVLERVSHEAAEEVARAMTKLAGQQVNLKAANSNFMPLNTIFDTLGPLEQHAIVVYTQVISGAADGVAMLVMSREDAMALVDILNQQPLGTTGVLKDIDRSAIKETLNILANAYMNVLANSLKMFLVSSIPNMVTSVRMREVIGPIIEKGKVAPGAESNEPAVFFETSLMMAEHQLGVNVYLIFNKELANLLK